MAPTPEAKKALDDMAKMIKEMSQDTPEEKAKVAEMKKQFEDFLKNTDDPKKMEELTQMMQMMTMMTADPTAMLAQGMAQAQAQGAQAGPTVVKVVNPSRETNLAIKKCYNEQDPSDWDGSIARLEKVLEERKEHQTKTYTDAVETLKNWKGKGCEANIKAAVEARDVEKVKSLLEIAKTDEGGNLEGINEKGQPYCSETILWAKDELQFMAKGSSGGVNQVKAQPGRWEDATIVVQGPGGKAWAAFWEAQRTAVAWGTPLAATEERFESPEATVNFCKFGSNTGVAASLRGMASKFESVTFIHDKLSSLTWTTRFGRIKNGILYYFADDAPERGCLGCISLVGATVEEEEDPIKQNGNVWTFDLTSPQPRKPGEAAPSSWTMGGASQEEATSVLDTIKKFF